MSQNSKPGEFENYLEGKSELSRLYADLPEVNLPKHLDAAILAEAHRAVNARPGAKPKRRWPIPLGLVATLFLAVMIGLQLPYMLKESNSPQQYMEEQAAAMDKSIAERSSAAPEGYKKIQDVAKEKSERLRNGPATMAAEAEAPAKQNKPVLALPQESTSYDSHRMRNAPVVASPPAAAPAPAQDAAAKRIGSSESSDRIEPAKEKKASGNAAGIISDSYEQRAPAATLMAAPKPVQLERSLLKDDASEANPRPEEWLLRIKRLMQEGKRDEAKKDLAAFKKRYPDYPVPKDIELR